MLKGEEMAYHSKIEWTETTWNPTTGCTKISTGCKNCYAERLAARLKKMGQKRYANGFKLTLHEELIANPFSWKKPRIIFVNSMSDLFHEDIPLDFIQQVFNVMNNTPQHIYQVLTKRSTRLKEIASSLNWTSNIWMGVTVESKDLLNRIDDLKNTPAKIKFLSLEPLLSEIPILLLNGTNWVIVGGESGPYSRQMKPEWAVSIKEQCIRQNVPFFFKQWGGVNKYEKGRILEGKTWDQMPELVN